MTDHEHDWELHVLPRRHFKCSKADCNEILSLLKVESMLNEHAALKRVRDAAEELDELRPMTKGWLRIFASRITALQDALADTQNGG